MSFLQSIISRVANLTARTKILQDKVAGGGIQTGLTKISNKFSQFGLDSIEAQSQYERAQESTFRRIELQNLNAEDDLIQDAEFEESNEWERFRGSYETS